MQVISNFFMMLFVGLSMLGSLKIYIGSYLNWLILLLLLSAMLIISQKISLKYFIENLVKKKKF